jgi:hypothetical protein
MTIFINKEGKSGFSPRVKISAMRLHPQIGGIYAISADTNKLYEMLTTVINNSEENNG